MSSKIRVLPVTVGAVGVLLALRIAAFAASVETSSEDGKAPPVATGIAQREAGPAVRSEQHGGEHVASVGARAAVAETKGEADVLQQLGARRVALDARERDLAMREQLMGIAEKKVEERLAELRLLEGRLAAMLATRDEEEEKQLVALVKTYENMKPADAARIFNRLDRQVLLTVASRMKPAKIGAVMAAMEPSKAQDLTVMLALRLNPPVERPGSSVPAIVPPG